MLVVFLSWSLPLYGLIYNSLYPSYESALGVTYSFALGCGVHFLTILLWFGIKRRRTKKIELIILLTSYSLMIVLFVLSNNGSLSKFSSTPNTILYY